MTRHDDDRLLDDLRAALSPPPASPTPTELAGLRRAVAFRFDPKHGALRSSWSRRPVYLLAAALIFTSTTAVALTGGLPAPIRSLARAAGLSIDSTALVQSKGELAALRDALAANPVDIDAARKAALDLRESLKQLDANERGAIEAEASALLAEADRRLWPPAPKPTLDKTPLPQRARPPSIPAPRSMDDDEREDEQEVVEAPEVDEDEEDLRSIDKVDEEQIEREVLKDLAEVEKELRSPSLDGLIEERVRERVSKEVERQRKAMERSLEKLERRRKDIEGRRKDIERMQEEIERMRGEIERRREEVDEEGAAPGPLPGVTEEEIDSDL